MRELTPTALARLVALALEHTASLSAQPAEITDGRGGTFRRVCRLPAAARYVRVTFAGPDSGVLILAASEGFLVALTDAVLETSETERRSDSTDAFSLLASVIAQALLRDSCGEQCPISLGTPSPCGADALSSGAAAIATLDVENERLEVHWIRERWSEAA
jgi:hypothetical protein